MNFVLNLCNGLILFSGVLFLSSSGFQLDGHSLVSRFRNLARGDPLGSGSFSWKSCGNASFPTRIDDISVSPDPLKLPGNVTVGFAGQLNIDLDTPITLEVEMKKKVLFAWIKLPCLSGLGSCTYYDICKMIPQLNCPEFFQKNHIPCKCPIAAGAYKLPPSALYIDDSAFPPFLADGDYQLTGKLSKDGRSIACLHLAFSID